MLLTGLVFIISFALTSNFDAVAGATTLRQVYPSPPLSESSVLVREGEKLAFVCNSSDPSVNKDSTDEALFRVHCAHFYALM